MAGHALIEQHLVALARGLPSAVLDELADGLIETYEQHLARGLDPAAAAEAAVAEFGDAGQIVASFARQAPGRRTAVTLLATGPVFAACWGPSLLLGHAWRWPIPVAAIILFGLALLGVVATLAVAAGSRRDYHRTRLALPGGIGLVLVDIAMLVAVLFAAPALVWPMAVAIPASLARIGLTVWSMPQVLAN
ncbi:MAG: hypothetical protein GEV28_16680 [Actinophytocola sp.]|uniref:permease prefix domain 1-containing protein n=1 Tax=Actinophytocola sp. TaxID=1872138 RepID=UPI0013277E94|nr:permease prefix domain 1-containing protein [Actinophytocola sp.]MPZ81931.1 hypothetical protein [Actinophytocola sp.]